MNKILKKIFISLVFIFGLIFSINSVNAFVSSYTNIQAGTKNLNYGHASVDMKLKYSGEGSSDAYRALICTTYGSHSPAGTNTNCDITETNWDKATEAAVAAVIRSYGSEITYNDSDINNAYRYYCAEITLNQLLYNLGTPASGYDFYTRKGIPYSTLRDNAGCGENAYNAGVAQYNAIKEPNKLSLNVSNLHFTKSSDGYYYSDKVVATTNGTLKNPILSNSKFSYENKDGGYVFKISSADVISGQTQNLNVTFSTYRTYHISKQYYCGQDYQLVTPYYTENYTESDVSKSISGSITKGYVTLKIAKVNNSDEFVAGAKLMLQTEEQKNSGVNGTIYTSGKNYIAVSNISAGKYYLSEVEAPSGYIKTNDVVEIVVDNDDNITVDGKEVNGVIKIKNIKTKTQFSKLDATNNKEIKGATLQILDKDKKPIMNGDKVLYKWVSTGQPYVIEGLPIGKYYLKEVIAPNNYTLNEELVQFEVKADGSITKVVMKNSPIVPVENTASHISIALIIGGMVLLGAGGYTIFYVIKKRKNI